jgi:transcriptional/translational regulatory protein YebC/TACO1
MLEAALEAGASDVESGPEGHFIYTASDELAAVAAALEAKFGEARSQKLAWRPQTSIPVSGEAASGLMKLMGALEDCDDVQNLYANYDIAADEMERLAG